METAIFENSKKAMESLTIQDDEYIIIRHLLKPGKKVRPHYHPKATEWLIIDKGIFDVMVGGEWKSGNMTYQTTVFLFPRRKVHTIEAITEIEYFVLRNKPDKTIYVK